MSEPLPPTPPPAAATAAPAPGPTAPAPPAHRVTGLSCPSCGGTLEVAPGLRVVTCPFCDTPLLAVGEVGIRRFAVAAEVDAERAREVTRGWWRRGWNKDPRLAREAETAEAFLCFLPFFRVEADAIGYAFGTEQRRRTVGSGNNRRTETYEVDVERRAEKHLDETFPAVNVAEWGVQRVDLGGDRLLPYDGEALGRQGMVFPPTASESAILSAALAAFAEQADPARGLHRVRFRFLETLRERLTVVHYPLWVVRYRFRDRSYQTLIDAQDGELAYGKAPGNDLYRALMLVGTQAATCFVATTALQWGDTSHDHGWIFLLAALCFGVIGWGWRKFRYGGVVVEGTGATKGPAIKNPFVDLIKEQLRR